MAQQHRAGHLLVAAQGHLHRQSGPFRQQHDIRLNHGEQLAAETAADVGGHDLECADGPFQRLGQVAAHGEGLLRGGPNRNASRGVGHGRGAVGLDGAGMGLGRVVGPLDNLVRLRKTLFHVTVAEFQPVAQVALALRLPVQLVGFRVLVHQRRILGHRLFRVEYRGQFLVFDLHQRSRFPRRIRSYGRDRGHRFTQVAHFFQCEDALVLQLVTVVSHLDVPSRDYRPDVRVVYCCRRIDGQDIGVRERTAHQRAVNHARQAHVFGVDRAAGDLFHRIGAHHAGADGVVVAVGGQRIERPVTQCPRRVEDLGVAGAAAQVAGYRHTDFLFVRPGDAVEQVFQGQRHARRAETALDAAALDHGLLHRVQRPRLAQPLYSGDFPPFGLQRQHHAGVYRVTVQQHRATAAVPGAAAFFRAGQAQVDAQGIEQAGARGDVNGLGTAVDGEIQRLFFHCRYLRTACSTSGQVVLSGLMTSKWPDSGAITRSIVLSPIARAAVT